MVGDYMKALNRKEVLVNAKANGTLDSFKPLTRDEAFTKKALELGVTSWNDFPDKPFGETTEVVDDILCDIVIDGNEFYESYVSGVYETNINIGFFPQPGKTYKVIFDDVEYDCVAYIVNSSHDILLGNPAMCRRNEFGVEDSSKPFALLVGGSYGTYVYDNNSHSIKVIAMDKKVVTTVATLDTKYAPDYLQVGKSIVILPVAQMYETNESDGTKSIRLMPPDGMNINYEYTFKIRNDIYENVKPFTKEGYYDDRIWGTYDGNSGSNNKEYPFYLKAQETYGGSSIWDADGFFRGYGSGEPRYDNPLVDFGWVTEVYPDLDIETEVEIYAVVEKTFDGEYLPDYLQFGVPKDVDKCVFKDTISVSSGSGSSYNGLHALRADKVYTVIINDTMYKLTSWVFDGWGTPYICLGNGANIDSSAEGLGDSTVDFCIYGESNNSQYYGMYSETSDDYAVEIIGPVPTTGTLDPKYLPNCDIIFNLNAEENEWDTISIDTVTTECANVDAVFEKLKNGEKINVRLFSDYIDGSQRERVDFCPIQVIGNYGDGYPMNTGIVCVFVSAYENNIGVGRLEWVPYSPSANANGLVQCNFNFYSFPTE